MGFSAIQPDGAKEWPPQRWLLTASNIRSTANRFASLVTYVIHWTFSSNFLTFLRRNSSLHICIAPFFFSLGYLPHRLDRIYLHIHHLEYEARGGERRGAARGGGRCNQRRNLHFRLWVFYRQRYCRMCRATHSRSLAL